MSYNSRSNAASAATKLLFWWRPLSNGFVCAWTRLRQTNTRTHTGCHFILQIDWKLKVTVALATHCRAATIKTKRTDEMFITVNIT